MINNKLTTTILLTISTIIITYSCTSSNNNLDITNIQSIKINEENIEKIELDSLIISKPYNLTFHPNNFLLLRNMQKGGFITVIDLTTNQHKQIADIGRAANEILSVRDIFFHNDTIWVYSTTDNKILTLNLNVTNREFYISNTYLLEANNHLRMYPYKNNSFIALAMKNSTSHRISITNNQGKIIDGFGDFYDFPYIKSPNNADIQSCITVSPNMKNIAIANISIDYIDIYGDDMKLKHRLRGDLVPDKVRIEKVTRGEFSTYGQVPMYEVFSNITSSNDAFWLGYIGSESTRENIERRNIQKIIKFNWNGEIEKVYDLPLPIKSFTVDSKSHKIYAIIEALEPYLVSIKI
ncbi:MAG: BF3164 family lipoprotein [Rikenellaceae bacterium]